MAKRSKKRTSKKKTRRVKKKTARRSTSPRARTSKRTSKKKAKAQKKRTARKSPALHVDGIGDAVEILYRKPGESKPYRHRFGPGVRLSATKDGKALVMHGGDLRIGRHLEG